MLTSLSLKIQDVLNCFLLRLFLSLYKFIIISDIVVRELNLIQLASPFSFCYVLIRSVTRFALARSANSL